MAKQVKLKRGQEFQFKAATGGAVASKYPWDEWFNGDLLIIERSEGKSDDKGTVVDITTKKDFEVSVDSMPAKIKTAARRRYKVVQVSRRDADGNKLEDALIIQARDMTDEEKVAEDQQRAEEKEAAKAKKAEEAAKANAAKAGAATPAAPPTDGNGGQSA